MKISCDWLQSFFKKKLPSPEKLADLLTMHSFETEISGKSEGDCVLDVDVLPNRAHDCLSHLGIAKEVAALTDYQLDEVDYSKKIKEDKNLSVNDIIKIKIKDKNDCPRYIARAILDVKIAPSPDWIQKRLRVCGLRPINNVVDITNYVMLEIGQPLHAFDADKLEGQTIIVRRAKKGEKIISLDEEKYILDENILVIADEKNPIAIAGIKGGKKPEIEQKTKRVILEAANFSPQIVRKGSQQINLKTDSSWRFENEISPQLTEIAIDMAGYLIQSIASGQVAKGRNDVYPVKQKTKTIKLNPEKVRSLLGINISEKEMIDILKRLAFMVKPGLKIEVPFWRLDINIEEDLIEEIGRIYGFEKIPSKLPEATLIPAERSEDLVYQSKVRDILSHLGFAEVYNYSFVSEQSSVELLNPISQEQRYLRPNLYFNLLKNIRENKKYFSGARLFEIGKVFEKDKNRLIERKKLGVALFPSDFYRLKGVIETLLNKLRISDIWFDDEFEEKENDLKRAEVKVNQELLGWVGDSIFELDFAELVELAIEERIYLPPSKYPAVVRDIAVLVEPGTKVAEVLNLINAAGGELVRDVDLFDIYEGEEIPDNKKNLAFHIIFQSEQKTLTDIEVNKIQDKIIKALENEGGWEVRKQNNG